MMILVGAAKAVPLLFSMDVDKTLGYNKTMQQIMNLSGGRFCYDVSIYDFR